MNKRRILSWVVAGALLFASALTTVTGVVYAEEGSGDEKAPVLQISPTMRRISLEPGEKKSDEMTVENAGNVDFSFRVYAAPYTVVGDEYEPDFATDTHFTQISRWVTFDKTEFTLKPGEKQVVNFHINVPKDVPAGGQYASIFAETINDDAAKSNGIKTTARIGMIIYANVSGDTRVGAEIINFSLPTFYSAFNVPDITATARVRNTGNTDFEAIYRFKVEPLIGDVVYDDEQVQVVLPDTERQIEMKWADTPLLGLFKVSFSVVAGDASEEITTMVLVLPPWLIIIMLLLLTFLTVWIIIKVKRREQLRSKFKL
jgi:hypothetical protein